MDNNNYQEYRIEHLSSDLCFELIGYVVANSYSNAKKRALELYNNELVNYINGRPINNI